MRPAVDCSIPIEEAVRLEVEAMVPLIRRQTERTRARRTLGVSCGPIQLQLGRDASLRRRLLELRRASGLAIREWAEAIGYAPRTFDRHIHGGVVGVERRAWYDRVEAVFAEGEHYHIIVRRGPPTRKHWGWNLTPAQRQKLITGV